MIYVYGVVSVSPNFGQSLVSSMIAQGFDMSSFLDKSGNILVSKCKVVICE